MKTKDWEKAWQNMPERERLFLRQFLLFSFLAVFLIVAGGVAGLYLLRQKVEKTFSLQAEIARAYLAPEGQEVQSKPSPEMATEVSP